MVIKSLNIYFSLEDQTLRRIDNKELASDSINFIQACFTINNLSSYSWEAKLSKDTITYTSYPLLNSSATHSLSTDKFSLIIPKEYLSNEEDNANPSFYISLVGKDNNSEVTVTSNTVEVKMRPSLYRKILKPTTPSEAKAIEKQIADLQKVVKDAQAAIKTLEAVSVNNSAAIDTTNSNVATLSDNLTASQEKVNNMLSGTESFSTIAATGALNFGKAISLIPYEWWHDDDTTGTLFEDSFTIQVKQPGAASSEIKHYLTLDGNGQATTDFTFLNLTLEKPILKDIADLSLKSLSTENLDISNGSLNIIGGPAILMGTKITLENATIDGNYFSVFNGSTNAANLTELSILKLDENNSTIWNNCYTLSSTGITIPATKTFTINDGIGTTTFNTGDIQLKNVSTVSGINHLQDTSGHTILKATGSGTVYFGTTERPCHYYGVSWDVTHPIQPTDGIVNITMYHNAAQLYTGNAVAQKQINILIPDDVPDDYKSCFEIYAAKGCTISFTRGANATFSLYDDADKPLSALTLEYDTVIFVEARRIKASMILLTYNKTHMIENQPKQ